jgi:hypothetical protein
MDMIINATYNPNKSTPNGFGALNRQTVIIKVPDIMLANKKMNDIVIVAVFSTTNAVPLVTQCVVMDNPSPINKLKHGPL